MRVLRQCKLLIPGRFGAKSVESLGYGMLARLGSSLFFWANSIVAGRGDGYAMFGGLRHVRVRGAFASLRMTA